MGCHAVLVGENRKTYPPCGICGDRCVTFHGGWSKPPVNHDDDDTRLVRLVEDGKVLVRIEWWPKRGTV